MELLVELMLVRQNVDKLMKRAALRLCKLHRSYLILAQMPEMWLVNDRIDLIKISFLFRQLKIRNAQTSIVHLYKNVQATKEEFKMMSKEVKLRSRLIDMFRNQIVVNTDSASKKKNIDEFYHFRDNIIKPIIKAALLDPHACIVLTDES